MLNAIGSPTEAGPEQDLASQYWSPSTPSTSNGGQILVDPSVRTADSVANTLGGAVLPLTISNRSRIHLHILVRHTLSVTQQHVAVHLHTHTQLVLVFLKWKGTNIPKEGASYVAVGLRLAAVTLHDVVEEVGLFSDLQGQKGVPQVKLKLLQSIQLSSPVAFQEYVLPSCLDGAGCEDDLMLGNGRTFLI